MTETTQITTGVPGAVPSQWSEPVAIVGMALALPGATDLTELDALLRERRDMVAPIPDRRFRLLGLHPQREHLPAALLPAIEHFDHAFFGISPREARSMDPHQRLLLQLVWHAIEDAGHAPGSWRERQVGTFVTAHGTGYQRVLASRDTVSLLGTAPAAAAGRVSYLFGFHGPSLVLDTGCSSGLVAVQLACEALARGECEAAVVGGVSLRTSLLANLGEATFRELLAPSGRCRAFDAGADGTADGEGGVVLVLKPLSHAYADADPIRAVIRAAVVSHNGNRSNGFSAPSPVAQVELLTTAWDRADITAGELLYVEGHGSGTRLGDAIEVSALQQAWRRMAPDGTRVCEVSSIKSNIGHLDQVAGLAGLAKAVAALQHEHIYPGVNFTEPNRAVRWDGSVRVTTESRAVSVGPRTAVGTSAFSLTGTNAHVVLGAAPPGRFTGERGDTDGDVYADLVTLSAWSVPALRRLAARLRAHLTRHRDLPWQDVAYTLNLGREDLPHRLAFAAWDRRSLLDGLYEAQVRNWPTQRAASPEVEVLLAAREFSTPVHDAFLRFTAYRRAFAARTARRTGADRLLAGAAQELAIVDTLVAVGVPVRPRGKDTVEEAIAALATAGHAVEPLTSRHLPDTHTPLGWDSPLLAVDVHGRRTEYSFGGQSPDRAFARCCAALYELGAPLRWRDYYEGVSRPRLPLPGYPFDEVYCWPEVPVVRPVTDAPEPAAEPAPAPRSGTVEQRLADVWRKVLGLADCDGDTDYFAAGGSSVLALELLWLVEKEFGVRMRLVDLYEAPTVAAMVTLIERLGNERSPSPTVIGPGLASGTYQASAGQESLWILSRLWPDANMYNIPVDIALRGDLDVEALRAAFHGLIERHDVLRSRMIERDGQIVVTVDEDSTPDFHVLDVPTEEVDLSARWDAAWTRAEEEARRPFDLATHPPLRVRVYRVAPDRHLLLIVTHHTVDDGWTPALFARDLGELYQAHREGHAARLPELPVRYGDFAVWQRRYWTEDRLESELRFWRGRLAGVAPSNLPTDHARPLQPSGCGDHYFFTLDEDLTTAVRRLGVERAVSPFVVTMAAFKATLARWSRETDIAVGITTAGRDQPEVGDLIGYFNNAVALRTDLSGDPTFAELLTRERAVIAEALEHDTVPFADVVAAVTTGRDPSRHPIFQVGMTYQHLPPASDEYLPGVVVDPQQPQRMSGVAVGTAKWDLDLGIWDRVGSTSLPAVLEFSTDLWTRDTIDAFAESFSHLLRQFVARPELRLWEAEAASPRQARAELDRATGPALPVDEPSDSPVALFARQRATTPDRVFVRHRGRSLTYRETDVLSDAVAARLRHLATDARVATCMADGAGLVAAIIGIWKAGLTWVPFDPALPAARIRHIAAETALVALVVDDSPAAGAVAGVLGLPTVDVSQVGVPSDVPAPTPRPHPQRPAYVLFTSGSTGVAKGVVVTMASLSHYAAHWSRRLTPGSVVLTMSNPTFDVFVGDLVRALSAGGGLVLADPSDAVRAEDLTDLIHRSGVTVAEIAPASARRQMTALLASRRERSPLDMLIAGSEVWTYTELQQVRRILRPRARVMNTYGLTECTIDSLQYIDHGAGQDGPDEVPIGLPVSNTTVYLLDDRMAPVPPGAAGELYIGGPLVAAGYLGRPALTAERFVPDPFGAEPGARLYRTGDLARRGPEGQVRFLGRVDRQVKVNGVRVEPGEIEAVLRAEPTVTDVIVTKVDHATRGPVLGAVVEMTEPTFEEVHTRLARWLVERLPQHHIPVIIAPVAALPRLSNAKPDVSTAVTILREWTPAPTRDLRPDMSFELDMLALWEDVLGRRLGVNDNFFDVGGTSLSAISLVSEAGARFGVTPSVATLFRAPTVASFTRTVTDGSDPPTRRRVVRLRADRETAPCLFLAHSSGGDVLSYYHFARELTAGIQVFGLRVVEEEPDPVTFEELAAGYLAEIRQIIPPDQPLHVAGWSLGGPLAYEIARQWRHTGGPSGFLGLIDAQARIATMSVPTDEAELLVTMLSVSAGMEVPRSRFDAVPAGERFGWVADLARRRGLFPSSLSDREIRRLVRVNMRNDQALAAYRPEPMPVSGTLFRCAADAGLAPEPQLGWDALLGNVRVVQVPGSHYRLFADHSSELAAIFGVEFFEEGNHC